MKKTLLSIVSLSVVALPLVALAQDIDSFLDNLTDIINRIIPFLIAVATVIFIYGVVSYIISAGDEEKVKEARKYIIWGILGLAVIMVVWGLVRVVINSLDLDVDAPGQNEVPRFDRF